MFACRPAISRRFPASGVAIAALAAMLWSCAPVQNVDHLVRHEHDHRHAPGEILVIDPPPAYLAQLPEMGLEVREVTPLPGIGAELYHLDITDGRHPFHLREHHRQNFPDMVADLHHHFEAHAVKKTDKSYTARAAADWAKAGRGCGKGIRIGVVDGHLAERHPAFKGAAIKYRSFIDKGLKRPHGEHGTSVTAVLAGSGSWGGLVPGAEFRVANIFHTDAKGASLGSTKAIVRAIDWLIAEKVAIINLSFGGAPNGLIKHALDHAHDRGVVLIASGGNSGPFTKAKSYPAAYENVIAVTAMDRFGRMARFSSKGDYLEFAAPGVDIWTAVPRGGKAMSGTSFAAPIITGMAAAAIQHKGAKGVEGVRAYLRQHAVDKAQKGRDVYTGWGLVQLKPVC